MTKKKKTKPIRDTDVEVIASEGASVRGYGSARFGGVLSLPENIALDLTKSAPHRFRLVEVKKAKPVQPKSSGSKEKDE